MIIFSTKKNVIHLNNSCVWIVDGTFKVVPKEYYQLYIIHGKIFPLVYILMSSKTQVDYENMIKTLKEKLDIE